MTRWVTSNTRELPLLPQEKVVANHTSAFNNADVVAWQENGPDRYKADLLSFTRFQTFIARAGDRWYDSPISFRTRSWKMLAGGAELMAAGEFKVEGNRWATWALLRRKLTRGRVLVISLHTVPHAFSYDGSTAPRKDPAEAAEQPHRQDIWNAQIAVVTEILRPYLVKGIAAVVMGDFNRAGDHTCFPAEVEGRKVWDFHNGLDHIHFFDGERWTWSFGKTRVIRNYSDHPVFMKEATLIPRIVKKVLRRG